MSSDAAVTWYAVLFSRRFGYAQAQAFKATRAEERDEDLVLLDGERVAWRGPKQYVRELVPCPHQKAADERVLAYMEELRTSGFHGASEAGVAARRPRQGTDRAAGSVLEGVSVSITES